MAGSTQRETVPRAMLVSTLVALAVAIAGCTPNAVSFFIEQNQTPMMSGVGGVCTVANDPQALHADDGTMDISVRNNYVLAPLYDSELISDSQRVSGVPDSRGLIVDGADVELHFDTPDGALINLTDTAGMVPPTYRVTSNAYVPPASASGPGLAVGTLEIIPGRIGDALAATYCQPIPGTYDANCPVPLYPSFSRRYIAVIKPFGHTMGGVQVAGSVYNFPITFCCHCLVAFNPGDTDNTVSFPNCNSAMGTAILPCLAGQDVSSDCRSCSGNNIPACQPRGYIANPLTQPAGFTCPE